VTRTEDREYYKHRIIVERQRAKTAPSKVIADAHMRLADLYEALVEGQTLRVAFPTD